MISHRTITLAAATSTTLSIALTAGPALAQTSSVTIPADRIGVVGYTIRDQLEEDARGTLQGVAECGITNVEFSGSDLEGDVPSFQNVPVPDIVSLSEEFGFDVPSLGVGGSDLTERLDVVIEAAEAVGASYVRISGISEVDGEAPADYYTRLAGVLNEAGAALAEEGITLAYHNHDAEFEDVGDGRTGYDILLDEVDPQNAAFELDTYWAVVGGGDPVSLMQENPGRFPLMHVKDGLAVEEGTDEVTFTTVGQGVVPFEEIFANSDVAGVEYYFIENDRPDPDGVTVTCDSLEYLTDTFVAG